MASEGRELPDLCPECRAATPFGAAVCVYCGARLALPVERTVERPCPRCRTEIAPAQVGATAVHQCGACRGLWLDRAALAELLADRERQAEVVWASDKAAPAEGTHRPALCPICGALMNRVPFARGSSVIVDQCPPHGMWFDPDELRRVCALALAAVREPGRAAPPGRSPPASTEIIGLDDDVPNLLVSWSDEGGSALLDWIVEALAER